jgi:uncharacterized protein involved in exopolysaccharide biosynthesis
MSTSNGTRNGSTTSVLDHPIAPAAPTLSSTPSGPPHLTRCQHRSLALLAAACLAAGGTAGMVVAGIAVPQYGARAEIVYPVADEQPTGFLRTDRSLSTQLVLLRSNAVLDPVASQLGITSDALRGRVSDAVLADSEVIRVEVRAATRDGAADVTRRILDSYLAVAANSDPGRRTAITNDLRDIGTALSAAQDKRATLVADTLRATPTASLDQVVAGVDGDISSLRSRQSTLQGQLDELTRSGPRVVTGTYALAGAVSPRPIVCAGAGALLGLLIALGFGALRVRRWTRFTGTG